MNMSISQLVKMEKRFFRCRKLAAQTKKIFAMDAIPLRLKSQVFQLGNRWL